MMHELIRIMSGFYNNILELLMPHYSRRRSFYELGSASIRILANEGITSFAESFQIFVFNKWSRKEIYYENPTIDNLHQMREECGGFALKPKISIILNASNAREDRLKSAIESAINQAYDKWELCIAGDSSSEPQIALLLKYYQNKDKRIKVKFLDNNQGTAETANAAMALSEGEFTGFLGQNDELLPHALFEMVKFLNNNRNADLIYSDEVIVDEMDRPVCAKYRPNFSFDYLLSNCYFTHLVIIKTEIIKQLGGFRRIFSEAQDYDLFLRVLSETRRFYHIPEVLYLEQKSDHPESAVLSRKTLQDFVAREKIQGVVCDTNYPGFFRIKRRLSGNPLVSIIIPTRDKPGLLKACIKSLEENTSYRNYEVIIVDHLSKKAETKEYLESLERGNSSYRIIPFKEAFNYSRLNNLAARSARGEHILFLNNDIEIIHPEWLEEMLEQSQREEVGCVGAKLLYPNGKIQHAGVVIGFGVAAGHIYNGWNSKDAGYMGQLISIRNYSAVTAACMMVKKKVFDEVNGFDENLKVGFGDTDLCLRIMKRGYLNVYTPYAQLCHYESATRGVNFYRDPHKEDTKFFINRWQEFIEEGDPYYNPNLPLDNLDITKLLQRGHPSELAR